MVYSVPEDVRTEHDAGVKWFCEGLANAIATQFMFSTVFGWLDISTGPF